MIKKLNFPSLLTIFGCFHPVRLLSEPVMAVTIASAIISSCFLIYSVICGDAAIKTESQLTAWLWMTVLFAACAQAVAEQKGKTQAAALRSTREVLKARLIKKSTDTENSSDVIPSSDLKIGDIVLIKAGEIVPCDGDVIEGVANVDESAITGESNPVIRESGGDRSAVTAGTRVISDWIKVCVTCEAGKTALDRMIALIEGAKRQKSATEISLNYALSLLTLLFAIIVGALATFAGKHSELTPTVYLSLFVALIPTTIGGLMPAIAIAGVNRVLSLNVLSTSGKAVETAADVDVIIVDKTGTITLGNRCAVDFIELPGVTKEELVKAALLASIPDETPEGRSIVTLARTVLKNEKDIELSVTFIPFSAQTRLSGIDYKKDKIRKGAFNSVIRFVSECCDNKKITPPEYLQKINTEISQKGGTPLVVAKNNKFLGVIHLKDIVKPGIRSRIITLRHLGVKSIMVTGDNLLTAKTIAAEAGIDTVVAEAVPEMKQNIVKAEQEKGRIVGMCGDGTNDAPALAQADVAIAMHSGTQTAREAANLVDLDSDPTKIIEIIKAGRRLAITRGALATFSLSSDLAKYFAVIPALLASVYPSLKMLDVTKLNNPTSAALATTMFNALVLVALIPLALRGGKFKPMATYKILLRNLTIYGGGGAIVPFVAIKILDSLLALLGLA